MGADSTTAPTGVIPSDSVSLGRGGDYAEGSTVALTYRELADRLGVALEAAKARARRGGWKRLPGNDGVVRVQVPTEALRAPRMALYAPPRSDPAPEAEPPLTALHAALNAQAEAHRAELERVEQAHARELTRLGEAHMAELARHDAVHRAELDRTREVATVQARADAEWFQKMPGLRGRAIRWLVKRA